MAFGDGAVVRQVLGALVGFLRDFAAPTGARGSILLMAGGLVVLGFLFLALIFRSAIVGDLAPVANARAPIPRAALPPRPGEVAAVTGVGARASGAGGFVAARRRAREEARERVVSVDDVFDALRAQGGEARILLSGATYKRVRLYRCASCAAGAAARKGCEHERGILSGGFEALTGELAKVEEVACASAGAAYCEFDVRHAPLRRLRA